MTTRRWWLNGVLVTGLVAVAAACGSLGEDQEPETSRSPVPVQVEVVRRVPVESGLELTGTVRARVVAPLASKVMAQVVSVSVEEGSRVAQGDVLVRLDDRSARVQVAQAEATLTEAKAASDEVERAIRAAESAREEALAQAELAKATYARFEELFERRSISIQEFDEVAARRRSAEAQLRHSEESLAAATAKRQQAAARIEQAEAAVAQAEVFLRDCTIIAPFPGVVSEKQVEVGRLAVPGQPLLTLEDSSAYEVWTSVPESRIHDVLSGTEAEVSVEALGDLSTIGTVREIAPRADPGTRTFRLKLAISPAEGLHTGQFATVKFLLPGEPVPAIQSSSVLRRGQLEQVLVLDSEQRAKLRLIQTGRRWNGWVEVLSGLREGEHVILEPPADLSEGVPVRIIGSEAAGRPMGDSGVSGESSSGNAGLSAHLG